jgi:hypothetical protein
MYLNDLTSAKHSVEKLNRILAGTFNHSIDLSEMSTNSLNRMLFATEQKIIAIKESDLRYWENPQYNKLTLIKEQLNIYINEVAPARTDGKKMKRKIKEQTDLASAEVLLAAQELVDKLQGMVEDIAEMQVQELMPIVDAMKEQVGFDIAEQYNSQAEAALSGLLDQMKSAKEALENATLQAQGKPVNTPAAGKTDMGMDSSDDDEFDMGGDDEFGGDDAASGADNVMGRELKSESLDQIERSALKQLRLLEAKRKVLEASRNGKISSKELRRIISSL